MKDEKEATKLLREVSEGSSTVTEGRDGESSTEVGARISERFVRPVLVDWNGGKAGEWL